MLESWGLVPDLGNHAFDRLGHYLAGDDHDRLADLNEAFRDPDVRAILTTRGGKGSYRIAAALDFDAVRRNPKPLVGYSDVTFLHLALQHHCALATLYGPYAAWDDTHYGSEAAASLRSALMTTSPVLIRADPDAMSAPLTSTGRAIGTLIGGNLRSVGQSVGWGPTYADAVLLLESIDQHPGEIDGALTQLLNSGALEGVRGIAIGQFIRSAEPKPGKWSFLDIVHDRLGRLGVPMLGGLPIGHGSKPPTVPLGTMAVLDADAGTLVAEAAVR